MLLLTGNKYYGFKRKPLWDCFLKAKLYFVKCELTLLNHSLNDCLI